MKFIHTSKHKKQTNIFFSIFFFSRLLPSDSATVLPITVRRSSSATDGQSVRPPWR